MEIKGKLTIKCEKCGKTYDFLEEDVNFVKSEKKEKDPCYVWNLKFDCLRCGHPIKIQYEICVSSDGKIKEKNVNVEGAKVTEDSFTFSF